MTDTVILTQSYSDQWYLRIMRLWGRLWMCRSVLSSPYIRTRAPKTAWLWDTNAYINKTILMSSKVQSAIYMQIVLYLNICIYADKKTHFTHQHTYLAFMETVRKVSSRNESTLTALHTWLTLGEARRSRKSGSMVSLFCPREGEGFRGRM